MKSGKFLTREPSQAIICILAHILPVDRSHSVDKNSKRVHPLNLLLLRHSVFNAWVEFTAVTPAPGQEQQRNSLSNFYLKLCTETGRYRSHLLQMFPLFWMPLIANNNTKHASASAITLPESYLRIQTGNRSENFRINYCY